MLTLEAFQQNIKEVDTETNYYFVRTQKGEYFETFLQNGFIAYGYNQLTIDDLRNKSHEELRVKVGGLVNASDENASGKRKITSIINKNLQFINLIDGDIVVIPSENSDRFAIGVIDGQNSLYSDIDAAQNCPYYKRQKVKWLRQESRSKLPSIFHSIRTHHGISELSEDYHKHIDSAIHGVYSKGDSTYLVLDVDMESEIKLDELYQLIGIIHDVADSVGKSDETLGDPTIQVTLNSPGRVIIKALKGTAAAIMAFTLVTSCSADGENVPLIGDIEEIDQEKRERIRQIFQETQTSIRTDTAGN